jgi:hypothetical protein
MCLSSYLGLLGVLAVGHDCPSGDEMSPSMFGSVSLSVWSAGVAGMSSMTVLGGVLVMNAV